jgi:hypothetical protein
MAKPTGAWFAQCRDQVMGHSQIVRGHVDSVAPAINVANARLNNVNLIFNWIVPGGSVSILMRCRRVVLSTGMTAAV